MSFVKRSLCVVVSAVLLAACSSSDNGGGTSPQDQFDRQAMLTHWADNIIIPAFEDLQSDLAVLDAAAEAFVQAPDQVSLTSLREAWLQAYSTWQYVEMFNIGRAETLQYNFQMNVYPVTVADIQNNIVSGTYDLSSVNNQDAVGFPALDYLLYGVGVTDQEILTQYTTANNADGYKKYLSDLVDRMVSLTDEVTDDWKTSYRDAFVNNTANTATGAVNKLTNDFIFYYEKGLRANKFGIPAGVFSTQPLSDRVEAYYAKTPSKMLALTALNAVQDFFNGKAYGGSAVGVSFDDYLDYLRSIQGGDDLAARINDQFNAARSQMETLSDDLAQQVVSDNTAMTLTYDELQKAVVLLKVDMVQKLNITIDYVDADGD